jgi:hypothetical protein
MASARFITIFDFARYRCSLVAVQCRCGYRRHLPPTVLAEAFSWSTTIKEAERRLRCAECGRRAAKLAPVP